MNEAQWAFYDEEAELIDQLERILPVDWSIGKFIQLGEAHRWHIIYNFDVGHYFTTQTSGFADSKLELLHQEIALLENEMNIFKDSGLFDHLVGEMFLDDNGRPVVVPMTIKNVVMERVPDGRGKEIDKPVVHFKERDKTLVLNKSNSRAIAGLYGSDTDSWIGKRIAMTGEHGKWFGKQQTRVVVLGSVPKNGRKRKASPDPEPTAEEIEKMVAEHQTELDAVNTDLVDG